MNDKKTHTKSKMGRIVLYLLLAFFSVLLVIASYFVFNANRLIRDNLSNYIFEKSNHTYLLNFDTFHLDLLKREISISNISFSLSPKAKTDDTHNWIAFSTESFQISRIKIIPLIYERRFSAELVKVVKPKIEQSSGEISNIKQLSNQIHQKGDTLKLPVLSVVFFDTIQIVDAHFDMDSTTNTYQAIPKINIEATHFKLGGRKYTDSPFPFDVSDIILKARKWNKQLSDSIHSLTVDEIDVSLIKQSITANRVSLNPLSDTLTSKDNKYKIFIPKITIQSSQIDHLLVSDTLSIQSMTLSDPMIEIKFGTKVMKGTPLNEINLYKLIEHQFKWVKIETFEIKNADIKLIPSRNNQVAQHFEQLFLTFSDFKTDSTSYKNIERILSARNLDFSLSKFTLNHADQVHRLTVKKIKANTRDNQITTGKILFTPISNSKEKVINTHINTSSDGIQLKGIDFKKLYHQQIATMDELIIQSPITSISFQKRLKIDKKKRDKNLILEKTSDYLKGIYVEKTILNNGSLNYNYITKEAKSGFFQTKFSFQLSNLSIDSITYYQSDKLFFADQFELKFSDVSLQLADDTHRMDVKEASLSSKGQRAELFDLNISPRKSKLSPKSTAHTPQSSTFNIHFPHIQLSGADLHRAFFNKELYIQNFNIQQPVFNIQKEGKWTQKHKKGLFKNDLYPLIADYLLNITIQDLNMDNGILKLIQHQSNGSNFELSNLFSIKMKNFEIDQQTHQQTHKLFFSDNIDLILKDHTFTMADGVHKINTEEVGILSSEKRIYVKNAKLYPDILSKSFSSLPYSIFADIPEIIINNADIFGLFNKGNFPIGSIALNRPEIKLLLQKHDKTKTQNTKHTPIFLLTGLKSINVKHISINDGHLKLANYENYKSNTFANTDIDFEMNNFRIKKNIKQFKSSYSDFGIALSNSNFNLPDNIHQLTIQNIKYKLNEKALIIQNIDLKPKTSIKNKNQLFTLHVPKLEVNHFDFEKYINSNEIIADNITIHSPSLKIEDDRIDKEKLSPYHLRLYPAISTFANLIQLTKLQIENGKIELENDHPIKLRNINAQAQNFKIDEENSQDNKLFNFDHVDVSLSQLNGKTKSGYFKYLIDKVRVNTKGDLNIEGVSLTPLFSPEKFAQQNHYQADYYTIDKANFCGEDFDIRAFIEQDKIVLPTLKVELGNVSIHRDKTYPLRPSIQTKMPQEALRDLNQAIEIRNMKLTMDRFDYTELETGTNRNSHVFFTNTSAHMTNITNMRDKLENNPNLTAIITGKLMGTGTMKINVDMDVYSFDNQFTFAASCGMIPLKAFNSITEPGLKLSIKEGYNKKMETYFKANEDSAIGNIHFAYNDLKISILKPKDGEIRKGKFISFIVNAIALKSDNPRKGRILLPAKFENHRDKQRSFVGYCWKSIYAGIKSTLGVKEKEASK